MPADQLSVIFSALADPTRRAILTQLATGDANVADLSAPFRISQPAISRHLQVVERAGLISRTRRATARPPGSGAATRGHRMTRPLSEIL